MENVVWLSLAYPGWYFSTLRAPFADPWLTLLPSSGAVALAAGIVWAILKREPAVLIVVAPVLVSHAYVAIAEYFSGQLPDYGAAFWTYIAVIVVLIVVMIVRARTSRLAAVLVGWFALSYALFSSFIGAMAFADNWM
jgi:hypothetical protein